MSETHKSPRLYIDQPLQSGAAISINDNPLHYLRNVMRMQEGQLLRLFNGRDGEFIGTITALGKKDGTIRLDQKIKGQPTEKKEIHLLFTPLRKERMDFLIEKSVELGVTHLHPILTQNTDLRKINEERLQAQIIEAAEQCERLDIPSLSPLQDLFEVLRDWAEKSQIYAALERYDADRLSEKLTDQDKKACAFLIGPPGGFTQQEIDRIVSQESITPVSLGSNILRAETAAIAALSVVAV